MYKLYATRSFRDARLAAGRALFEKGRATDLPRVARRPQPHCVEAASANYRLSGARAHSECVNYARRVVCATRDRRYRKEFVRGPVLMGQTKTFRWNSTYA